MTTLNSNNIENNTCETTKSTLPTAEEYAARFNIYDSFTAWSEPKYKCPKCDGGMCRDETTILTSYPPQRLYRCNKCGHIDYQFG